MVKSNKMRDDAVGIKVRPASIHSFPDYGATGMSFSILPLLLVLLLAAAVTATTAPEEDEAAIMVTTASALARARAAAPVPATAGMPGGGDDTVPQGIQKPSAVRSSSTSGLGVVPCLIIMAMSAVVLLLCIY